jgi:hypothetical protein
MTESKPKRFATVVKELRDQSGDDPSFLIPTGTRVEILSDEGNGQYIVRSGNSVFPVDEDEIQI